MIGDIESGVEETRMAQREYDSFAIGVQNDGDAVAPLDLSINVWADVGHTSEIDFGIQIPHRDELARIEEASVRFPLVWLHLPQAGTKFWISVMNPVACLSITSGFR